MAKYTGIDGTFLASTTLLGIMSCAPFGYTEAENRVLQESIAQSAKDYPFEQYQAELEALAKALPGATAKVMEMDEVRSHHLTAREANQIMGAYFLNLAGKGYHALDEAERPVAEAVACEVASNTKIAVAKNVTSEMVRKMIAVYEQAAEEKMRMRLKLKSARSDWKSQTQVNGEAIAESADQEWKHNQGALRGGMMGGMAGLIVGCLLMFANRDQGNEQGRTR